MKSQRGFTLIETMVAVALLAVIVVTILGAFGTTMLATTRHKWQSNLDRLVRSDAEYIKSQPYRPGPATNYANLVAAGYTFSTQVLYYNPASQTFAAGNADQGLQEIVLTATAPGGGIEKIYLLKAQP
jgi:prepilin-type N-terminal cleavage/methylation domain-containing protein